MCKPVLLRRSLASLIPALVVLLPGTAQASFLSGDALDTMADVLAWVVLVVVPIGVIVLFWLIHVLPEKIAHKRHHPQLEAIKTLCLLSLVFGGLLWPFAWLWAYTRPTAYKIAYGTDKHDDYYVEMGARAKEGALVEHEVAHLRDELDSMAARGHLPPELKRLRRELDSLRQAPASSAGTKPAPGVA
jgi:hypothetical protein